MAGSYSLRLKVSATLSALLKPQRLIEVVGDGATHTLHIYRVCRMASLLEPDQTSLIVFNMRRSLSQVTERVSLETRKLDEIEQLNFLKIDVQGSELAEFQSGRAKVSRAVAMQTGGSFVALCTTQPAWGNVELFRTRSVFSADVGTS